MRNGKWKLALVVTMLCVIWLALLPWVASRPRMVAHVQWLDETGVDPSAMYYTELDMMRPILTRLALEQRNGDN